MSGNKNLHGKLEAVKEKAVLRDFEVTITETLQMEITVEVKSRDEAKQIVSDNWKNGDYIIDDQYFTDAKFEASPVKPERSRGE